MKILGLIPARSGSRRVKDKNIRPLGGNPLMAYTITAALKASLSAVVVSTDSEEYSGVATFYGAHALMRPAEISGDCDTGLVAKHALEEAEKFFNERYEAVMILQPTSPFRESCDIIACISLFSHGTFDTVFSVKDVSEHPAWMFRRNEDDSAESFLGFPPRILSGLIAQELPDLVFPNGAIYLVSRETALQGKIFGEKLGVYQMPPDRSLDIETEWDLRLAELMLEMKEK